VPVRRSASALVTLAVGVLVGAAVAAAPAQAASLSGIDVSNYQGSITWSSVKASGENFAYIKATEGQTYTDPRYATNAAGAASAGLIRGAYHYGSPDTSTNDAVLEAEHFVAVAGTQNGAGQLPPTLDIETSGGLSVSALRTWVQSFLTEAELLTGRVPVIYTGPSFWSTYLGGSTAFTKYPLWIAQYTSGSPTIPGGWSAYTFWQNTSSYSVSGISGSVDHDWFNGTAADLAALSNGGGTPGNPYTATGVCGTGYSIIDQQSLVDTAGVTQGIVYLLYNSGTGGNCVATLKATSIGTKSAVAAYLEVQGQTRITDSGSYSYYAGPVSAVAANTCVKWGGSAGSATYDSPFEHCG
jgi:GH25 family lysozyme M1 (1,4-beta-N-acetylmuramidase)